MSRVIRGEIMMTIVMMNPDCFDYDDLVDFDNYPDVYSFIDPDDYELYHDLHGSDDCGLYCISQGEAGGMSYWAGVEKGDDYEGNGVLPWTGSVEPVHSVLCTFGLVESVNSDMPCWTVDG